MTFNLHLADKDKKRREGAKPSEIISDKKLSPPNSTFNDPVAPIEQQNGGVQVSQPSAPNDWRQNLGKPEIPGGGQVTNLNAVADSAIEAQKIGIALNSPAMLKIRQNLDSIDVLKTMPVTDEDGRTQSALKALLFMGGQSQRLLNARDWGDVGAGLAQMAGGGIGGLINKTWNEEMKRKNEVDRLQAENDDLMKLADREIKSEYQTGQLGLGQDRVNIQQQRTNIAQRQLGLREARNKVLNLKDEQKMFLEPFFKTGVFYEDALSEEQKTKMRELGIVMEDFDLTKKPRQNNGQWEHFNAETRMYEPTDGLDVDPDEVPMTIKIDGQEITASRKHVLNYLGAKERQASQQNFQAGENDKNRAERRAMFVKNFNYKVEQDAKKGTLDKIKLKAGLQEDLAAGDIEQADFDEITRMLDNY